MKFCLLLYIELSSSFPIGRKRGVNFRNQRCDVITADYTIIMSKALKVAGNHVMYDCSARFLWVIMKLARFVLLAVSEEEKKHDFHLNRSMYNKTIFTFGFVISRIIKVSLRVISRSRSR